MMEPKDMSFSQRLLAGKAEERPSYFMCGKRSVRDLVEKAEREAEKILQEFKTFYTGDVGIVIKPVEWLLCYSIGAVLTVNGETCREYDDVELCFLDLNELMLKRMIETGIAPKTDRRAKAWTS